MKRFGSIFLKAAGLTLIIVGIGVMLVYLLVMAVQLNAAQVTIVVVSCLLLCFAGVHIWLRGHRLTRYSGKHAERSQKNTE